MSIQAKEIKLLYATSIVYPSVLTNRLQILQMSQAFSRVFKNSFFLGVHDVRGGVGDINLFNFPQSTKSFLLAASYLNFARKWGITHIYCREEKLLFFMLVYNKFFFRMPTNFIYEAHWILGSWWYKVMIRLVGRIIAISLGIKNDLCLLGVGKGKILVEPDAVDLKKFSIQVPQKDARIQLGLPVEEKIVMYTGSFGPSYDWKGCDTLLQSETFLPDHTRIFYWIIGGTEADIDKLKYRYRSDRLKFQGRVDHDLIPLYLRAADLLVIPNKKGNDMSEKYTSPMKLFEYMASGVPIVATKLPSIMEIVDDSMVFFCQPNDPKSLGGTILEALNNPELSKTKIREARQNVNKYTWDKRAERIFDFITNEY